MVTICLNLTQNVTFLDYSREVSGTLETKVMPTEKAWTDTKYR